jgi:hypothetical protein
VLGAAPTAASAVVAWRTRQRLNGRDDAGRLERSAPLMAFVGVWLNAFFTLLIVLSALPPLFLVACDWI